MITMKRSFASLAQEPITAADAQEAFEVITPADYPNLYRTVGSNPTSPVSIMRAARDMDIDVASLARDIDTIIGPSTARRTTEDLRRVTWHTLAEYENPNTVDPFVLRMLIWQAILCEHVLVVPPGDTDSNDIAEMASFIGRVREELGVDGDRKIAFIFGDTHFAAPVERSQRVATVSGGHRVGLGLNLLALGTLALDQIDEVCNPENKLINMSASRPVRWIDELTDGVAFSVSPVTRGERKAYHQTLRQQTAQRHRANESRGRRYLKRK